MVRCFKKPEITLSDLKVSSHDRIKEFYVSSLQSGDSPVPLLVVRAVLALLTIVILMWAVAEAPNPYWLLYLTNWGIILLVGMMVSGLIISIAALQGKIPENTEGDTDSKVLPWYVMMYWVFYNTGITMAFLISALYWILLFNPSILDEGSLFWLDVATHGVNSVIALIELVVSRTPVYIIHFYQPLCCGLWYALFTFIYYTCGGVDIQGNEFIYEILDWYHKTRSSVVVLLSVIGLIVIWLIMYAISLSRGKISDALFRSSRSSKEAAFYDGSEGLAYIDYGKP